MPIPGSERALRRLVSRLAQASDEDIQAILAGLEERQRETVEGLLKSYQGATQATATAPSPPPLARDVTLGLSPWLANRVVGGPSTEDGVVFQMTPAAAAALRKAAEVTAPADPTPLSSPVADPPFWGRFRDTLRGGRTET